MRILPQLPALRCVISGGQTGVDRAALDWAIDLGLTHGGWCPKGRVAEDGVIPDRYRLRETESARYAPRTRFNVIDANATLILNLGVLDGGTLLTLDICRRVDKPHLIVRLDTTSDDAARARAWLLTYAVGTLNVAGPRESKRPGVYAAAAQFLSLLANESADRLADERLRASPMPAYPTPTECIWDGSGPPPPGVHSTYNPPPPYRLPWLRLVRPAGPDVTPATKPERAKGE